MYPTGEYYLAGVWGKHSPLSFHWQVTAGNKLVEERGKGTDNISMSDLKLQHSWFKNTPEK